MAKISVVLWLLSAVFYNAVSASVDECYKCDDSSGCNDPFDKDNSQKVSCRSPSNVNQLQTFASSATGSSLKITEKGDYTSEFVCLKAKYPSTGSVNGTWRGCIFASWTEDIIYNYLRLYKSDVYDIQTCDSNLCNSGNGVKLSQYLLVLVPSFMLVKYLNS